MFLHTHVHGPWGLIQYYFSFVCVCTYVQIDRWIYSINFTLYWWCDCEWLRRQSIYPEHACVPFNEHRLIAKSMWTYSNIILSLQFLCQRHACSLLLLRLSWWEELATTRWGCTGGSIRSPPASAWRCCCCSAPRHMHELSLSSRRGRIHLKVRVRNLVKKQCHDDVLFDTVRTHACANWSARARSCTRLKQWRRWTQSSGSGAWGRHRRGTSAGSPAAASPSIKPLNSKTAWIPTATPASLVTAPTTTAQFATSSDCELWPS